MAHSAIQPLDAHSPAHILHDVIRATRRIWFCTHPRAENVPECVCICVCVARLALGVKTKRANGRPPTPPRYERSTERSFSVGNGGVGDNYCRNLCCCLCLYGRRWWPNLNRSRFSRAERIRLTGPTDVQRCIKQTRRPPSVSHNIVLMKEPRVQHHNSQFGSKDTHTSKRTRTYESSTLMHAHPAMRLVQRTSEHTST